MIKGNIGKVTISEKSILVGDTYFVHTYKKNKKSDAIKAGDPVGLVEEESITVAEGTDPQMEVIGVALSDSEKNTEENVSVVVFGQVKKSEVNLLEDPQLWKAVVKSLRHNGVYLI